MPVTAKELFAAGKVREAEKWLTAHLREHPADTAQRIFLFELLCFAGEYAARGKATRRARQQQCRNGNRGNRLLRSASCGEDTPRAFRKAGLFPTHPSTSPRGELNGKAFTELRDADPDIGARLEVFAAGAYVWIPFEHVASVEMGPPQRLRDTLWAPALVQAAPSFQGMDLGEVLIPAIYPFSWKHANEAVWLGRMTDWAADDEGREYPSGQKILLVDGEEFPFLEVRSLTFAQPAVAPSEQ